jgi:Anti-sigma-K factor rskA/Sigma-70, region 4
MVLSLGSSVGESSAKSRKLSFRAAVATFDQLSAEQRAILELILQRGQAYSTLAGMLNLSEDRVRELAHEALSELAPITSRRVEDDWRSQVADYILGQQAGPESTATRGHLRRSEPARAWARSLLDSLETLYGDRALPSVPEGERFRGRAAAAPERRGRDRDLSPEARSAVRRRRLLAIGGAAAAALLVAVLVWPVGVLTGDDDADGDGGNEATPVSGPSAQSAVPAGIAIIAERNGERQVIVQAAGLDPSKQGAAYEVWLYNSPEDAKSLGAQVTDQRGTYQGAGPLPEDFANYKYIDVSKEPINDDGKHSGQTVLRGRIGKLRERPADSDANQAAILGQVVLQPPGN